MKISFLGICGGVMSLYFLVVGFDFLYSGGKAGSTGSPGESTCAQCHSGGSSSASSISITANPQFQGNSYVPGQVYTISILATASGFNSYGFGCEILNSSNANAGTMQNPGTGVQLLNAFNGRMNATHTAPKSGNPVVFSFEWVAPSTGGNVVVYTAVNAVNGNGATSGDYVMTASLSLQSTVNAISSLSSFIHSVSVFPNPFTEELTLQMQVENNEKNVQVMVYDFHGKKVFQSEFLELKAGMNRFLFDFSSLQESIYVFKVLKESKVLYSWLIFRQD